MGNYTINSFKRIVLGDPSNPTEIKKVVYCDQNGTSHQVWPGATVFDTIKVATIRSTYQNDDILENYPAGGPFVAKPNVLYAIVGNLKRYDANGNVVQELDDCYNSQETIEHVGNKPTLGWTTYSSTEYKRQPKDPNSSPPNQLVGEPHTFTMYKCTNTDPGEGPAIEVQSGWWAHQNAYAQNGFIFDDNYATPFIFQRDTITQSVGFYTTNTSNGASTQIDFEGNNLQPGDTLTFWPKYYKRGVSTDWSVLEPITFEHIDYDTSRFTVTKDGDSYVIAVKSDAQPTSAALDLTFYTKYDANDPQNCESTDISIEVQPSVQYLVKIGNDSITGTGWTTTTSVTLDTSKTITVYKDTTFPPSFGNDTIYSSNITVSSSNGVIASCSGRTITPGESGTAIITVTVDGVALPTFTVTVPATVPTVYYRISDVSSNDSQITYPSYNTPQQLTSDSIVEINAYSVSTTQDAHFAIKFSDDSSGNNLRTVYIDMDGESYIPGYYSSGKTGEVRVEASGDSEWTFEFRRPGTSSNDTFYVELPVYAWWGQNGLEGYIGTITVIIDC